MRVNRRQPQPSNPEPDDRFDLEFLDQVFYHPLTGRFLVPVENDEWIELGEGSTRRELIRRGFSGRYSDEDSMSVVEGSLNAIQRLNHVSWHGALAGYSKGFRKMGPSRILITSSPSFVPPISGCWVMLEGLLQRSLGPDQLPYFYSWIRVAMEMYRRGKRQPGQALVLAGPPNSGKSLIQNFITLLFGGREADPFVHMTGETNFNGDLLAAEHLKIEDAAESNDIRSRRRIGAMIKAICVNENFRCERKFQEPLTLQPLWRLTISLNDDPERLQVLPPLDDDIADKMMLFLVERHGMPIPTGTPDEREAFWGVLEVEAPAFVHWLLNEWNIPPELHCPRYGVTHYHHPALVQQLRRTAPEEQLLEVIDSVLFSNGTKRWGGWAVTLEGKLTDPQAKCCQQAKKILTHRTSCGTYLGRLEKRVPERISSNTLNGRTQWIILAP